MIQIKVNNQQLYIPKETAIILEVNNSIFDPKKIEGEIIYTFEIPRFKNEQIFNNAQFTYINRIKKYKCIISCGGIEIANGELVLQKITPNNYSCGVIVNPFPIKFANKKLNENEYKTITISDNPTTHKQDWLNFLQSTLSPDSKIKFPLFINSKFYDDRNKDFGFYLLDTDELSEEAPAGYQASIFTDDMQGLDKFFVNRLFTDENNNIIEELNPNNRGVRIFNKENSLNGNSFTFAPSLQYIEILKKTLQNANYSTIGNFEKNKEIQKIYHQSTCGLDENVTELQPIEIETLTPNTSIEFCNYEGFNKGYLFINSNGQTFNSFRINGTNIGTCQIKIKAYVRFPQPNLFQILHNNWDRINRGQIYIFALHGIIANQYNTSNQLRAIDYPNYFENYFDGRNGNFQNLKYSDNPREYLYNNKLDDYTIICNRNFNNHPTIHNIGNDTYYIEHIFETNINQKIREYEQYINNNNEHRPRPTDPALNNAKPIYCFFIRSLFGNYRQYWNYNDYFYNRWNKYITYLKDGMYYNGYFFNRATDAITVNTFAQKLHINEHLPDITNSELINNTIETFGTTFYIDSQKKQIEFSFIKDILEKAKAIDLTPFLLNKETEINEYKEKNYTFRLQSTNEKDKEKNTEIEEAYSQAELDNPKNNQGKLQFIINENRYVISEKENDNIVSQIYNWNDYSGNIKELSLNAEIEQEQIKPHSQIPENKTIYFNENTKFITPKIEKEGTSKLYSNNDKQLDLILINYLGKHAIEVETEGHTDTIFYEWASPVWYNKYGQKIRDGLNLTAKGENSLGGKYIQKWLQLLNNHEEISHKFILPLNIFLETWQLLKPQNCNIENQKRWVIVENIKLLPKTIKFQFETQNKYVLTEILFAKEIIKI